MTDHNTRIFVVHNVTFFDGMLSDLSELSRL
jgi:hypothetical protein